MSRLTVIDCAPVDIPSVVENPMEWLKVNCTYYKISELAARVGVSIRETCQMLEESGINLNLTQAQEDFIREYYCEYTVKELAIELSGGLNYGHLFETKIIGFIQKHGIKKKAAPMIVTPKKVIKRVRGEYQNKSHADRMYFWNTLSLSEIKNHKGRINY